MKQEGETVCFWIPVIRGLYTKKAGELLKLAQKNLLLAVLLAVYEVCNATFCGLLLISHVHISKLLACNSSLTKHYFNNCS